MRRAAKVDANQPEIVAELRKYGVSVRSLSKLGEGIPDLLVGWRGRNFLMEIKDPKQPRSDRSLNRHPDEAKFHSTWQGQVAVVESFEEAWLLICS